jgi:2-iminobutanoate/2-iminopropanoate deaminase
MLTAAEKTAVQPKEFPPGAPYSAGILSGGTLYVSGQTGRDLKTNKIPDNFEAEVQQTLDNINLVLKQQGMTFGDAISVQVYMTDLDLFERMNTVYKKNFPGPRPARTTVGVAKLLGGAHIEITVAARK